MARKKDKGRLIVEWMIADGLAESAAQAKALIMAGKVLIDDVVVRFASERAVPEASSLRLRERGSAGGKQFVSRAGEKLHGALQDLAVADQILGAHVLDVGSSTGGFVDCCLQLGAAHVWAVDVGTNQCAWKIRTDPRVSLFEQTDIRAWDVGQRPPTLHWVLVDVSFTSIVRLASTLTVFLGPETSCLILVKPQFELPSDQVPPGGVVVDDVARHAAVERVVRAFAGVRTPRAVVESRIAGASGNREIFVLF